ncbi:MULTISPECIES: pyridoxal-phosphate dependent enzyme [unclassified Pseudoalteromonas]|uniref:1-aminocyclopropane-1-carboxylate deaminase/D-cysteine desulfhydrase n=1 Tax=unclassified Pseudoalteromonas TaxID=194690 RepID=UPI000730845E|nr:MULTISPECIES: pyridoxal-phosphate dependent enzyme [unclassified Pseudoalteromonas]KTD97023.1 1-aminocyclopropane-1-carboxylate deaminase [Pseudoalteromonas sp. H71]MBW4967079.1 pyridoxal-phosphate dependent enzyme [Pseudoalteromonas sp. CR1]TMN78076.1 1-aminocyclopropane-1-carboxylate deaminase [Pseudoalteromonas sp. S410]TMN90494.1 1-aminocyclopropane-1-carboxylate deaminase [Pseudoalteromonas sp. S408]TMN96427.1 1-aminocyclopropane-1-carboxylate deaminase [Pseudoalteromonas sp. S407]|tara:strand:+ start:906 stop:1814 length:909 start_codon:yes stop_codon:yes gene_type:complete
MPASFEINETTITQKIDDPWLKGKGIELLVKRDDLLHPLINGNKWRKLKYNLIQMQSQNKTELLTFGGAFSNHIHACAAAGKMFGLTTHGIIRGPNLDQSNPTIQFAQQCGMQLHVVNRIEYKLRNDAQYLADLRTKFPNAYFLAEGGTNTYAIPGCAELAQSLPKHDYLVCPTGSGGTLAGLIEGSNVTTQIIGIAVLKQAQYLIEEVRKLSAKARSQTNWQLLCDFHGGGYGKFTPELWAFCQHMSTTHNLPLEPIYSGKMLYALWQLIEQDYFPFGSKIIAVHTGGLQGLEGLKYRKLI